MPGGIGRALLALSLLLSLPPPTPTPLSFYLNDKLSLDVTRSFMDKASTPQKREKREGM